MTGNSNPRKEKAQAILRMENGVKKVDSGTFEVRSQTGIGAYRVENRGKWNCNCPDWIKREEDCKHVYASRYFLQIEHDTAEGIVVEKVPITYSQAWTAYNAAQTNEIRLFDELLKDLVQSIPNEPQVGAGRPRVPLGEAIFCSVQKVYSQLSLRRSHTLFRNAEERHQIDHAPHFNIPSKLLNRADITPVLHRLIHLSALPLASIERDFATDSTGFRTTSFGCYNGEKHGERRENIWLKAHLCTGVKTNIVTAITITDANGGDAPEFTPLLQETAEGFNIEEVSADKAYSSRTNQELVTTLGGKAFIPFKDNATGKTKGSEAWKKAFYFFKLHREEFDEHYHKRSNVESTIGAIKKKLGETLKSKNRTAQVNELLCKVLAYNITVLIMEMFVSGIDPAFLHLNGAAASKSVVREG